MPCYGLLVFKGSPRWFRWGWAGPVLVSLIGVAYAAWMGWWVVHAERTVGKAGHTSYSSSSTAKSAGSYTVHVHFTTRAGEPKVVGLRVFSRTSYPEGSSVPVIYDPRLPGIAMLDTWLDLWLVPAVLLLWGGWWSVREWRRSAS